MEYVITEENLHTVDGRFVFSIDQFFYVWLEFHRFHRHAQFHITTPQRVIRIMHYSPTNPGCVHSSSRLRSSPGGSLTIRTTPTHLRSINNTAFCY